MLGLVQALESHEGMDRTEDADEAPETVAGELRFLSTRLTEALREALRVAECRGARLPVPGAEAAAVQGRDTTGPPPNR